jgi:hypothetical protein
MVNKLTNRRVRRAYARKETGDLFHRFKRLKWFNVEIGNPQEADKHEPVLAKERHIMHNIVGVNNCDTPS